MRGIECEIEEAEFHIHGLLCMIAAVTTMPRPDASVISTLSWCLGLAHDRLDVLDTMKQVVR